MNSMHGDTVEAAWRLVLAVDKAESTDNFFEAGGDSMLALALLQRIEDETGVEVPVEALFVEGTLGAVQRAVASAFAA